MSRLAQQLRKRNRSLIGDSSGDECDKTVPNLDADILINKPFTLYRCTPLYKFEPSKLYQYAKEIRKFIEGQLNGILPFDILPDEFENISMLKEGRITDLVISRINIPEWNALNDLPIGIEIQFKTRRSSTVQKFYLILFPSTKRSDDINDCPSFRHYPLIIVKAPQRITNCFIDWIQRQFDCRICRYYLQSPNLKNIVEEWAEFILNQDLSSSRQIEFTYSIPNISEIKNIMLRMSFDDIKRLYNRRKTQNAKESLSIIDDIETHFFHCLRIKFASLVLSKVSTNVCHITYDGKLKLFTVPNSRLTVSLLEKLVTIAQ